MLAPSSSQCHRGKDLAFGHEDAVWYFATVVPYFPRKAPNRQLPRGISDDSGQGTGERHLGSR